MRVKVGVGIQGASTLSAVDCTMRVRARAKVRIQGVRALSAVGWETHCCASGDWSRRFPVKLF